MPTFLDDKIKPKITKHSRKQFLIGDNSRLITILGTQILKWCNSKRQNTLHRQLIQVEIIRTKTVLKKMENTEFKDRLF